ncbi:MAG: hypothetical protein H7A45_19700 [Verrucomicrobiales bacterium]|nr:hypothetical protein [Verrucomicrobiales bacterium]MCP5525734.1 hypothetical protein [Verrucomicrobiales bacterium]
MHHSCRGPADILQMQSQDAPRFYEQAGFRLESHRIEREWQSGAFRRCGASII